MSPILANDLGIDMTLLSGVTQDSREVKSGYLFAALKGEADDGRDYIDNAIANGARYILSDDTITGGNAKGVTFITTAHPRQDFAAIVAAFYARQPRRIIAVTGTNGKSSTVHFIDQMWRFTARSSGFIGTLSGGMTTPDPVTLHSQLAQMAEQGVEYVAMEASSHGLEQRRMDGVHMSVAAFTSFSQDHLDYHADMESYLAAKMRLFEELLPEDGVAVLNADSDAFDALSALCARRNVRVISYGYAGQDLTLISCDPHHAGQRIKLCISDEVYDVDLPLVGAFQVMNILCALGCVLAEDMALAPRLIDFFSSVKPVPGRLQRVQSDDDHAYAYVDYAHTPDALENVLGSLRGHTQGRLICVFGCGGDRDTSKRPMMGDIAARLANIVIITDDNPRSEEAKDIRADIMRGAEEGTKIGGSTVLEIAGRGAAITHAVSLMEAGDILLVAGKGHEQGQIFNGFTEPFDDVCEVARAMRVA